MITLTPKFDFKVPVDGSNISPDVFEGKTRREIESLSIWEGNHESTLNTLFHITLNEDQDNHTTIKIIGDLRRLKKLGSKMSFGQIIVKGNVGMRLGEEMTGGVITVKGNADSWAGMMMKGGTIEISGDAKDYIGSAYRGSTDGMRGGTILVHGNAGQEVGCFMRNGFINVKGNVGSFAGIHLQDGTILIEGNVEERLGGQMIGGRIVVLGHVPSILPTFYIEGIRKRVRAGADRVPGPFYLFTGDHSERGSGRLYISIAHNTQFKLYEKYLE